MITKRDIGKKCRMIQTGEIGKQNKEDKVGWILNSLYKIIDIDTDGYDTYVNVKTTRLAKDIQTSYFSWRMELCDEGLEELV